MGNTAAEAMAPPPNAVLAMAALALLAAALAELAAVVAAELELTGPCATATADPPPATKPAAVLEDHAPVRINRLRKSSGFC
jgi:hypothetical protein